jgi:hypothetical protein
MDGHGRCTNFGEASIPLDHVPVDHAPDGRHDQRLVPPVTD